MKYELCLTQSRACAAGGFPAVGNWRRRKDAKLLAREEVIGKSLDGKKVAKLGTTTKQKK